MKRSSTTQQKFISVNWKAFCDPKLRAFDSELLLLKQSQSPTGLTYDLALLRVQIVVTTPQGECANESLPPG